MGAGRADARKAAWAEEAGAVIADAGAVLVCGGLGGVMGAALKAGRPVIGLDTWELGRAGVPVEAVIRAHDAASAVQEALARVNRH